MHQTASEANLILLFTLIDIFTQIMLLIWFYEHPNTSDIFLQSIAANKLRVHEPHCNSVLCSYNLISAM